MRHACMILAAGLLLGLAPSTAQAKRSDFIGTWRNAYNNDAISEIRVNSSYQVYVNGVTYAGTLVTYGTTGAPDGHTTALIVIRSGATTTTLVLGLGTLFDSNADRDKVWAMKLVDKANYNSDGNTHKYLSFYRYVLPIKPLAPTQVLAKP